jgi:hypothetical protein
MTRMKAPSNPTADRIKMPTLTSIDRAFAIGPGR